MRKILVCEDEAAIREFVVLNLRHAGFTVIEADSGEAALTQYTAHPDIAIAALDVMLPCMDGFAVCKRLRAADPTLGIVMLTARSQEAEKVQGLHLGADDYITKPFSPVELIARLEALYRRVQILRAAEKTSQTVARAGFTLDLRTRTLQKNGDTVDLTQIEYQILEYLFAADGDCRSREDILRHVWGETYVGDDKVVDVNIHRLRNKTEGDPTSPRHLLTVRGKGYMWQD